MEARKEKLKKLNNDVNWLITILNLLSTFIYKKLYIDMLKEHNSNKDPIKIINKNIKFE